MNNNQVFVLVWRTADKNHIVCTGTIGTVQAKKKALQFEPCYKSGKLIIRTQGGLTNNPNWIKSK